jgi:predicted DNA-binding protein (UPF0278 family)
MYIQQIIINHIVQQGIYALPNDWVLLPKLPEELYDEWKTYIKIKIPTKYIINENQRILSQYFEPIISKFWEETSSLKLDIP